jgi:Cellulase (glycosyl hydrolase family 5)
MIKPLLFLACILPLAAAQGAPLSLDPENPHYFLFREKPTVLITSGEHYGAVLNLDFDYVKYLETLAADGMNLTRTFSGAYAEPAGAFHIEQNTLAPASGRLLAPWARSPERGYANGGNRFDLMQWDPTYFARLRDFVTQASERGIVVEFNLFCPMYEDAQWGLSPMNAVNNINHVGEIPRNDVYDLKKNGDLQAIQEAFVRKVVSVLADADNVYYEICNEPYFGGVTLDWQRRIAQVIAEAEKSLPMRHLISQNVANGAKKVDDPIPEVSIFNFHYANPPDAVAQNYGLGKVVGENETGFKGTDDDHYRMEAWEFLLAGGGLFNNLDYSFTVGHEDGTFQGPATQPGGGNAGYRRQLKTLGTFLRGFDFVKMKPAREAVKGPIPANLHYQALAEEGRQYALYFKGALPSPLRVELPAGKYRFEWFEAATGKPLPALDVTHPGGVCETVAPAPEGEYSLRIKKIAD